MPENSTSTEVTAAGIARLAGVGRAAVSNWRRRHADFPKPVGGTETSPSFALPEVEQWLRDQGKLAEVPLRERVWQQLAGHPAGAVPALVHTGCALLLRRNSLTAWREIAAVSDEAMAGVLSLTLKDMLADRFGPATVAGRAVHTPGRAELLPSVPLLRGAAEMAAETGARETFEFLLGRQLDANPRQYTLTPPGLAELMAALVETGKQPARTVFDPAAGTGALLRAVDRPTALYAQEADPDLAALTALRLALHTDPDNSCTLAARAGDTLRADAFPQLAADAVLCHPPFNERNWGHDELAYDPRWEYGFPARTESELAWVQHALAHLREGGTAVLLMPPAAASRRSGRRIRADLLRRGALRAVIALPAGCRTPVRHPAPPLGAAQAGQRPAPLARTAPRRHRRARRIPSAGPHGRHSVRWARPARLAGGAQRRARSLAMVRGRTRERGQGRGRERRPRHRTPRRRRGPGPRPPSAVPGRRGRAGRADPRTGTAHRDARTHRLPHSMRP